MIYKKTISLIIANVLCMSLSVSAEPQTCINHKGKKVDFLEYLKKVKENEKKDDENCAKKAAKVALSNLQYSNQYNNQYYYGYNPYAQVAPSPNMNLSSIGLNNLNYGLPSELNTSNPPSGYNFVMDLKAGDIVKVIGTRVWYSSSVGSVSVSNPTGQKKLLSTNDSEGLVFYINDRLVKVQEGTVIQVEKDCKLHAGVLNAKSVENHNVNATTGTVGIQILRK